MIDGHIMLGIAGGALGLAGLGTLAATVWAQARGCRCHHDDPAGWVPGMADEMPVLPAPAPALYRSARVRRRPRRVRPRRAPRAQALALARCIR